MSNKCQSEIKKRSKIILENLRLTHKIYTDPKTPCEKKTANQAKEGEKILKEVFGEEGFEDLKTEFKKLFQTTSGGRKTKRYGMRSNKHSKTKKGGAATSQLQKRKNVMWWVKSVPLLIAAILIPVGVVMNPDALPNAFEALNKMATEVALSAWRGPDTRLCDREQPNRDFEQWMKDEGFGTADAPINIPHWGVIYWNRDEWVNKWCNFEASMTGAGAVAVSTNWAAAPLAFGVEHMRQKQVCMSRMDAQVDRRRSLMIAQQSRMDTMCDRQQAWRLKFFGGLTVGVPLLWVISSFLWKRLKNVINPFWLYRYTKNSLFHWQMNPFGARWMFNEKRGPWEQLMPEGLLGGPEDLTNEEIDEIKKDIEKSFNEKYAAKARISLEAFQNDIVPFLNEWKVPDGAANDEPWKSWMDWDEEEKQQLRIKFPQKFFRINENEDENEINIKLDSIPKEWWRYHNEKNELADKEEWNNFVEAIKKLQGPAGEIITAWLEAKIETAKDKAAARQEMFDYQRDSRKAKQKDINAVAKAATDTGQAWTTAQQEKREKAAAAAAQKKKDQDARIAADINRKRSLNMVKATDRGEEVVEMERVYEMDPTFGSRSGGGLRKNLKKRKRGSKKMTRKKKKPIKRRNKQTRKR